MKILLLCEGRVGSYSLMNWIKSNNDNLKIVGELEHFDHTKDLDVIVKRSLSNDEFNLKDNFNENTHKFYDKIIILYRENTLEQSESSIWAQNKKNWHPNKKYVIDIDFLKENHNDIWELKYRMDELLTIYKSFNYGFKISYEDIFENRIGQKLIEDYLGFKSNTPIENSAIKLRINNELTTIESLHREIKILKKKLFEVSEELKDIKIRRRLF
jgi:uncharacterized protein YxjI